MLKKLFLIGVLLLSPTVGYTTAFAEETATNGSPAAPADNGTSALSVDIPVEQNGQAVNSLDNQDQSKITQEQTTVPNVTQNQDVKGDPASQQKQNADVVTCQQQTTVITAACQDENAISNEESANQSQSADIQAVQTQDVASAGSADAEQEQGTGLKSNQSQDMLLPSGLDLLQTQGTGILTDQVQSAITNGDALILQGQLVNVLNSQEQNLLAADAILDKQKQATAINAFQLQYLNASDSAKMEQTQEADIQSEITDTEKNKAEAGVNVKTRNSLEFIKETSANAVKLVQEIFVNNILVDVFNRDYSLNENHSYVPLNQQTYQKQFDWGNLFVSNEAVFSFNEEWQNFEGTLTSTLSLILNGSIFGERSTDNPDQNNDNGSSPDNNGDNGGEPSEPVITDDPSHETNDGNNIEIPATPVTAETSQVSKQEVTEVPTATANDQSQPVSSKPNVIENGKELPNTSTNNFNVLLLGILLLAAGIGILFRRKMKQN